MGFINTNIQQPGIIELLFYKASTGKALAGLAQSLLHGPSGLTSGERELIAAYVSKLNSCEFCHQSHAAAANAHLDDGGETIAHLLNNPDEVPVSSKMKKLLKIAEKVQVSGRDVTPALIKKAKEAGASDEDIHDTVLIAAAFCMFNRYVDGLGTLLPSDSSIYKEMGERLAFKGYKYPPGFLRRFVIRMMNKKKISLKQREDLEKTP